MQNANFLIKGGMIFMRFGFKLAIRLGCEEEYERRHKCVDSMLLDVFRESGVNTYSIFRDGCTLYAYMEAEDIEQTMSNIAKSEANSRWQAFMSDILVPLSEGQMSQELPEVFWFHS